MKRPRRLVLIFVSFVVLVLVIWDRQILAGEHELQNIKNSLGGVVEDVHFNGKFSEITTKHVEDDPISIQRREKVKEAMLHAWTSYVTYAWGQDELQPQTKNGIDSFGGLGATIIDSLDTLYIMGLDEQFQKAKDWVASSLDFNKDYGASVFETTIRIVGGLLSAYDLSGDEVFLAKAKDVADRLLPAWDTPTGIPYNRINLAHGNPYNPPWTGSNSILADSGSEQLEFIALSQRTGDPKYQQKLPEKCSDNVLKVTHSFNSTIHMSWPGLVSIRCVHEIHPVHWCTCPTKNSLKITRKTFSFRRMAHGMLIIFCMLSSLGATHLNGLDDI